MNTRPVESGLTLGTTGAHRPTLYGTQHMAVAGHYLASHAAFAILEAGGNATDAGVAAGIVLGVVQCDLVNVAGIAPIMVHDAKSGRTQTISGLGPWPALADNEIFLREHGGLIPPGLLRTVVPGAPSAWIKALRHFGTMSFGEVAQAAIRFARDGFVMYPLLADALAEHEADYRKWPSNAAVFLPGGRLPQVGEIFIQSDLARTLQYLADEESAASGAGREAGLQAVHDAFYRGDIARTISAFHEAEGGWLRFGDFASFEAALEPAVMRRFGEAEIHTCGPWTQGPVIQQTLALLDPAALKALGHNSPAYIHRITEALKLAFADRERFYGDPRVTDVPLDALLAEDNLAARRALLRDDRAWTEMPPHSFAEAASAGLSGSEGSPALPGDTSFVCVVDRHGNAFAATPSDTSYDSVLVPGTGLCPSSRGTQSFTSPGHPAQVAPGVRPRLTCNPALAIKPGAWTMPFGTPGGDVQCQAMVQVLLNRLVFGMDLQLAVEAPRFASYSFPGAFQPHEYFPGRLALESRIAADTARQLGTLGHDVHPWPDWTLRAGAVCAIQHDHASGVKAGAADPRRTSYAVGW
ncbi:gamma-glutamyltransferase [Bosea sp. BK604]|uniref:gamma-glutamyltransferase family protein n=1 Tax=Bosea sp. BK604 TaxID=2512180 RepID=UPI001A9FDAEC|nr:gamma-glutamyltransferase [Bosea sp. BK604]